ncbi:MAG: hypothetical protein CENE_03515 [Candidatus Celerinatantimonas neptuna]|nr:MAG: hypothetical protein CENE_03515 [Candidatus Celerinatantimonas neptuna]
MHVELIEEKDLNKAVEILLLLRPKYSSEQLSEQIKEQQCRHQYQLIGVFDEEAGLVGVAGFIEGCKLAWGRYLLIEDLMVTPQWQQSGAGGHLLKWLRHHGLQLGCKELHVNSSVSRFSAHKFYLQEGFRISSHHFSLQLQADATAQ